MKSGWLATYLTAFSILAFGGSASAQSKPPNAQFEHFERRVRPVLVAHCYACHSAQSQDLKGGLRLDLKSGWQTGGDSGEPAIIPGDPENSLLIRAIRHAGATAMPPNQPRLSDSIVHDLAEWIRMGAPDPRQQLNPSPNADWESVYQMRLNWWSLKPIAQQHPPPVRRKAWIQNEVDAFILSRLENANLAPAPEASRPVLARRLSFGLTGLPPTPELVQQLTSDESIGAFDKYVERLLESPHFGEHWARHWMDVVHYSDTHGYEWDAPAKNAWMFRDYLTRAFNSDVPVNRLILEQIAGDLIEPRIEQGSNINESLVGPMALRLGERRHGDSAAVEGVTQEAMANIIDTVSKGFLGTTVACAQCHDHKLDAISQADYYALKGIFMSTRWSVRCLDVRDPNESVLERLRQIKRDIRVEIADLWRSARPHIIANLQQIGANEKTAATFPETLTGFWQRSLTSPVNIAEFDAERARRNRSNADNLELVADFTIEPTSSEWRFDGFGMKHGLVPNGELVVSQEGELAVNQVLPAGRWSHVWSPRLSGALYSPQLDPLVPATFSIGFAGGQHVGQSFIVDQAFHSERMKFLNQPQPGWLTVTAGEFDTLEGSIDRVPRRVYLELVTKSLNNYFPPRTGYGGLKESDADDPRSWFGITRIYRHPRGVSPRDELERFAPLFETPWPDDGRPWAERLTNLIVAAIDRWRTEQCSSEDALLLNDALQAKLLPNSLRPGSRLSQLVHTYREVEKQLQTDRTIGSMWDWREGRDERLGLRGSYTELGDLVPRGNARLFDQQGIRAENASSGRLELARSIAANSNPLTARVFVNRVWLHLFGQGLVRSPDDFGHLGEPPTHPELLDYLATRFIQDGWSLKKLVLLLVTSSTWRQSNHGTDLAVQLDPENRLWHHRPTRRLEAESVRDAILFASGRLDPQFFGPSCDPFRTAQDPTKRLFSGPVDGHGRRSIYTKITLMEPPRFLSVFNLPIPKLTTGQRDSTNVPAQALTLLNDPFVLEMSKYWSEQVLFDDAHTIEHRLQSMFALALGREPDSSEQSRLAALVQGSALARGLNSGEPNNLLYVQPVWQDVAHSIFNLQEFIYVP